MLDNITHKGFKDEGKVLINQIDNEDFNSKYEFFYIPDGREIFLNLLRMEHLNFI